MAWRINNIDISTWGMIPGNAPQSNLAIEGHLDFPSRLGKNNHPWGDQNGVEPYVSTEETFFTGRNINFHFLLEADDENAALNKLMEFYSFLDQNEELLDFETEWGTFQVLVRDEINISYQGGGWCTGMIPFREPEPDLSGTLPVNGNIENVSGIDGVDFADLGFELVDFQQMGVGRISLEGLMNRARPKPGDSYGHGKEHYQITKTDAREYKLAAVIERPDYAALKEVVKGLYMLFKQPGVRVLLINPELIWLVYCRNGFEVKQIRSDWRATAYLEINLTEAEEAAENETYLFLGDTLNRYVTTTTGQKILVKI